MAVDEMQALPPPIERLTRNPLPLVLVLSGIAAWRVSVGLPLVEFRFIYGVLMVPVVLAADAIARKAGVSLRALGLAMAALVLFELLIFPLHLYARIPFLNRFEHFTAFLLLSALATGAVRMLLGHPLTGLQRAAVAFVLFQVGMANELVEYFFRWGTAFFSDDTILDITMNACAISSAQLVGGWRDRHT